MAKTNATGNGKKGKDVTQTFGLRKLKQAFDGLTGDLAKSLRGKNRGTRGIDEARRAKGSSK